MARTVCLVCFISSVNGHCNKKKKRKKEAYPWKAGPSRGHITKLKQSILETFDIYDYKFYKMVWQNIEPIFIIIIFLSFSKILQKIAERDKHTKFIISCRFWNQIISHLNSTTGENVIKLFFLAVWGLYYKAFYGSNCYSIIIS